MGVAGLRPGDRYRIRRAEAVIRGPMARRAEDPRRPVWEDPVVSSDEFRRQVINGGCSEGSAACWSSSAANNVTGQRHSLSWPSPGVSREGVIVNPPVRRSIAELSLEYHQIFVEDSNMDGVVDEATLTPSNGLVGVEPGRAVILAGIHTGKVNVTVEFFEEDPGAPEVDRWDEVVDVTLESFNGQLVLHGLMSDVPDGVPVLSHKGPGTYRLRVHARGRDQATGFTPDEPVEDYKLNIWPAPPMPEAVHKQSDDYGSEVRTHRKR